ncbi:MAG: bifunctional phosphoribosylaminoimidazolecarboxamide formyltransferase/IMP cyclohydrolase [Rickettsiales bacterium]
MTIKTALISVSDKRGITEFASFLAEKGITILSTGGTAKLLKQKKIPTVEVSEHTGFPEILGGRVKTLHPHIHGGILARRDDPEHMKTLAEHGITPIDLVVINLYPFEQAVQRGADEEECIEEIDIGGPCLIRASAKNHQAVTVIVDPDDYALVTESIKENKGSTSLQLRKELAARAFARTAMYDSIIADWMDKPAPGKLKQQLIVTATLKQTLRYGENPHQKAGFYQTTAAAGTLADAKQIQGKELSYNNLLDAHAALELVREFSQPAVAIIKHNNPCGVAQSKSLLDAYTKALACDKQSAYGGIIALNRAVDGKTAAAIADLFAEVIIAPDITEEAKAFFSQKKNLRVLTTESTMSTNSDGMLLMPVSGGLLVQQTNDQLIDESLLKIASKREPTKEEMHDLRFAFTVCKHVKSNAIVLARDSATVGIGAGQMSRVDSVRIACWKAEEAGLGTKGSVLASDAFFPFDDNVHAAAKAGITAIIQPGGSIRDEDIIKAADKYDMAMVFTGIRHFRH